jgi:protein phosphatase
MLYQQGKISREQMRHHPQRNMLTRAVGVERVVRPDYYHVPYEQDAVLLLCSDGLSSYCSEAEILDILIHDPFAEMPQALVNLSLEKGGRDNISLAIVTK